MVVRQLDQEEGVGRRRKAFRTHASECLSDVHNVILIRHRRREGVDFYRTCLRGEIRWTV